MEFLRGKCKSLRNMKKGKNECVSESVDKSSKGGKGKSMRILGNGKNDSVSESADRSSIMAVSSTFDHRERLHLLNHKLQQSVSTSSTSSESYLDGEIATATTRTDQKKNRNSAPDDLVYEERRQSSEHLSANHEEDSHVTSTLCDPAFHENNHKSRQEISMDMCTEIATKLESEVPQSGITTEKDSRSSLITKCYKKCSVRSLVHPKKGLLLETTTEEVSAELEGTALEDLLPSSPHHGRMETPEVDSWIQKLDGLVSVEGSVDSCGQISVPSTRHCTDGGASTLLVSERVQKNGGQTGEKMASLETESKNLIRTTLCDDDPDMMDMLGELQSPTEDEEKDFTIGSDQESYSTMSNESPRRIYSWMTVQGLLPSTECNEEIDLSESYESLSLNFSDCDDELSLKELRAMNKNKERMECTFSVSPHMTLKADGKGQNMDSFSPKKPLNEPKQKTFCKGSQEKSQKIISRKNSWCSSRSTISPSFRWIDNSRASQGHVDSEANTLRSESEGMTASRCSSPSDFDPCDYGEPETEKKSKTKVVGDNKITHTENEEIENPIREEIMSHLCHETRTFIEDLNKQRCDRPGPPMDLPKETQDFLDKLRKKSCARVESIQKIVDNIPAIAAVDLKTELEIIDKLDVELREKEYRASRLSITPSTNKSICSSRQGNGPSPTFTPPNYYDHLTLHISKGQKQQRQGPPIRATLEHLDENKPRKANDKIKRNILNVSLGPDARHHKLKPEEEELVEQILAQPDIIETESGDNCSTISYASTGYDFEGEDAKRLAEIDAELEQLGHPRSDSQLHSEKENSEGSICTSRLGGPSGVTTPHSGARSLRNFAQSTREGSEPDKGCHRSSKKQPDHISVTTTSVGSTSANNYLELQKLKRANQERLEEIDKQLKELQEAPLPKISNKEVASLVLECRYELGLDIP